MFHHINNLDNLFFLTRVGDYRKIPVFGLGSSLRLNLQPHAGTPLLSSRYRHSTVQQIYSTVQYTTLHTSLQTMSSPCSFRCLVKSPQYFLCKDTFLYSFTVFLEKGVFYIQFYSISWKKACFLYSLTIFPGKEAFIYNLTEFPGKVIFSI